MNESPFGKCGSLSGIAIMRCLAVTAANEISDVSRVNADAIKAEAAISSSRMQKKTRIVAKNYLQVDKHLDKPVADCSKFVGIDKIDCLTLATANKIENVAIKLGSDLLKVAVATAKKVTSVTAVIKTISGFEKITEQVNKANINLVTNTEKLAKKKLRNLV